MIKTEWVLKIPDNPNELHNNDDVDSNWINNKKIHNLLYEN